MGVLEVRFGKTLQGQYHHLVTMPIFEHLGFFGIADFLAYLDEETNSAGWLGLNIYMKSSLDFPVN